MQVLREATGATGLVPLSYVQQGFAKDPDAPAEEDVGQVRERAHVHPHHRRFPTASTGATSLCHAGWHVAVCVLARLRLQHVALCTIDMLSHPTRVARVNKL
jgi:hypothetical protein